MLIYYNKLTEFIKLLTRLHKNLATLLAECKHMRHLLISVSTVSIVFVVRVVSQLLLGFL